MRGSASSTGGLPPPTPAAPTLPGVLVVAPPAGVSKVLERPATVWSRASPSLLFVRAWRRRSGAIGGAGPQTGPGRSQHPGRPPRARNPAGGGHHAADQLRWSPPLLRTASPQRKWPWPSRGCWTRARGPPRGSGRRCTPPWRCGPRAARPRPRPPSPSPPAGRTLVGGPGGIPSRSLRQGGWLEQGGASPDGRGGVTLVHVMEHAGAPWSGTRTHGAAPGGPGRPAPGAAGTSAGRWGFPRVAPHHHTTAAGAGVPFAWSRAAVPGWPQPGVDGSTRPPCASGPLCRGALQPPPHPTPGEAGQPGGLG